MAAESKENAHVNATIQSWKDKISIRLNRNVADSFIEGCEQFEEGDDEDDPLEDQIRADVQDGFEESQVLDAIGQRINGQEQQRKIFKIVTAIVLDQEVPIADPSYINKISASTLLHIHQIYEIYNN